MTDLGAQVERYETDNRRRAVTALLAVVIGTPVLAFGVFSFLLLDNGRPGASLFISGIVIGGGVGVIVMGIVLGVQSVRRRGEAFTLYEAGFVHSWGTKTTVVPWTDVVTVTDVGKNTFLAKAFGGDVGCQVQTTGGRKVLINAFTDGAALLIHRIFEATGGRPA